MNTIELVKYECNHRSALNHCKEINYSDLKLICNDILVIYLML